MKKNIIFIVCILIGTMFMGIGYATVNNVTLSISGISTAADNGSVKITNVTMKTKTSNVTASTPTWTDNSVSFNVSFTLGNNDSSANDEHSATYEVTIYNDSIYEYSFGSDVFNPTLDLKPPRGETLNYAYDIEGIKPGDKIPAKSGKTFTVKLTLYPSGGQGTYSGGVETDVTAEESNDGILHGSFKDNINTGDLTGNNETTKLTISVINSYQRTKEFTITSSNSNFIVVDENGNENPTFQIPGSTESQDFDIYLKLKDGVKFGNSPQRFNLYINPSDDNPLSIGSVLIDVDVDASFNDNEPPTISSVDVTKISSKRSITATWEATDNVGVDHYDVYVYNSNNEQKGYVESITDNTYTFDNLANGTYYAKVIAYDGKGNSSTMNSSSTAYSWTYNVKVTSCENCSADNTTQTVDAGGTATVTLTGDRGYTNNSPSIKTVIMTDSVSGEEINLAGKYTYSGGTLTIDDITGDVNITAEGIENGCLVKGTKILLANGNYKNVEDITYTDLLAVWNYNDGTITYEYPLWIEKEHHTNEYIKVTFSDNSYLNIAINHSLYSTDDNKFINLDDKEFKIGTNIAKVNNKGEITKAKITNIETIKENTTYYFVGSTTYYNIIANDVLTTDKYTLISNLYGFNDNAIWPKEKDYLVNSNNIITYSNFKDVLPYYLYKGFRVKEAGFLVNYNLINLDDFKTYIRKLITNDEMLVSPPTDNHGNRLWMVTTSFDSINDFNKKDYLYKEGSTYILPKEYKIKKWYSTSENIYYNPGDKVEIWHGMHFTPIYK